MKKSVEIYAAPKSETMDILTEGILCASPGNGEVEGGDDFGDA